MGTAPEIIRIYWQSANRFTIPHTTPEKSFEEKRSNDPKHISYIIYAAEHSRHTHEQIENELESFGDVDYP